MSVAYEALTHLSLPTATLLTMTVLRKNILFLGSALLSASTTLAQGADPCASFAGQSFVVPAQALACLKSFPFNDTLRQNVISVISGVFDFYTFEDFYLDSPPPFQESTANIRAIIAHINNTHYEVCMSSRCSLDSFD